MGGRARVALVGMGMLALAGSAGAQAPRLRDPAPDVKGGPWVNSAPLTTDALRGRVVLVEFWTYG